jgi:hypothetical protein
MARQKRFGTGMEETEEPGPADGFAYVGTQKIAIELTQRSISVGQHQRDLCDANHPKTSPNYLAWMETNAVFRRGLCDRQEDKWTRNDEQNIPRVISPEGDVSITCAAGNQGTGLRDGKASTKRPRGPAGMSIINRTKVQVELVELLPEGERGDPVQVTDGMYFLLWYRVKNVIRSEISLARAVNADGTLIDWARRTILPEFNLYEDDGEGGDAPRNRSTITPTTVDVPVERLAS